MSDPSAWPSMPYDDSKHILFWANYSTQFLDTPQWLGPEAMRPTQPLPAPPAGQETVALYFTGANVTNGNGTMYSQQCWIRSATSLHNMTVDSLGFVVNESSVTTYGINDNAPAGDEYRLGKYGATSTVSSFKMLDAFLRSEVFVTGHPSVLDNTAKGFLGSYSIVEDLTALNLEAFDPTDMVMSMLNDLLFRVSAISGFPNSKLVDPDLPPDPEGMQQRHILGYRTDPDGTVYLIKLRWYIIAASIQGLAVLFAASLYWGWWQLGRHVSFSPIEIAKAFDAPLLQEVNTNARAKDLLHDVGDVSIRYGAVRQRQTFSDGGRQGSSQSDPALGEPCDRPVFGLADETLRPYGGQKFSK